MPELPEVETTCRGIAPHITGQTIIQAQFFVPKLRWEMDNAWPAAMQQQIVTQVTRRSKVIQIRTEQGCVMIHLGMSGRLHVLPPDVPREKHDHVDIFFDNDICLRYRDPRRFGMVAWTEDDPNVHWLLKNVGPEPFSDAFNADYALEKSAHRKIPIKAWLMSNPFVVGVGNIYATEALFLSRIHPLQPANTITHEQWKTLIPRIHRVLNAAIAAGGSSLRDFTYSDGRPGYFQQVHQVYGKAGNPCKVCGATIESTKIAQRTSAFCPACQPLP